MTPNRAFVRALVCCALLAVSCGGDPVAPTIDRLEVSPPSVRPGEQVIAAMSFFAEDLSLSDGRAEILLRHSDIETSAMAFDNPLGEIPTPEGTITVTVHVPQGMAPGSYELSLALIDNRGLRSNRLTSMFEVAR